MAARRNDGQACESGLWVMVALAVVLVMMRFFGNAAGHLKFRWDDNAYGSLIWIILGTHLTYLLAAGRSFSSWCSGLSGIRLIPSMAWMSPYWEATGIGRRQRGLRVI